MTIGVFAIFFTQIVSFWRSVFAVLLLYLTCGFSWFHWTWIFLVNLLTCYLKGITIPVGGDIWEVTLRCPCCVPHSLEGLNRVLRIQILMSLGLLDPHPDLLFTSTDPDPPSDHSIIKQNSKINLDLYCFVTFNGFLFLKNDVNVQCSACRSVGLVCLSTSRIRIRIC